MKGNPLNSGSISIYVANMPRYSELQENIRILWYQKYAQSLTKSEVLLKSMHFLRDTLAEVNPISENSPKKSINEYCRFPK